MTAAAEWQAALLVRNSGRHWAGGAGIQGGGSSPRSRAQARQDRADADEQRQVAERRDRARDNERKARAAEAAAKESDATANEVLDLLSHISSPRRPPFEKVGLGRGTLRKALDAAEPKIAAAFSVTSSR